MKSGKKFSKDRKLETKPVPIEESSVKKKYFHFHNVPIDDL